MRAISRIGCTDHWGFEHGAGGGLLALANQEHVKMDPIGRTGLMMVPITFDGKEKQFLFNTSGAIELRSPAPPRKNFKLQRSTIAAIRSSDPRQRGFRVLSSSGRCDIRQGQDQRYSI